MNDDVLLKYAGAAKWAATRNKIASHNNANISLYNNNEHQHIISKQI